MEQSEMMLTISQVEFWEKMKTLIEKVVETKLTNQPIMQPTLIPEKALLKASEVCEIFQVTKPTLYDWLRQNKIASFKIQSRRYFARTEIEALIKQKSSAPDSGVSRNNFQP